MDIRATQTKRPTRTHPTVAPRGVAVLVALSLFAAPRVTAGDFEYWTKATFLIPIKEHWQFGFEQKLGFEDEGRRLDHQMQDYGLLYSEPGDWLKLFAVVKVVHEKSDRRDAWVRETRPHLNAAVFSKFFGADMINRSRIEYRDVEDKDIVWRFRHKLIFLSPVTFTAGQITPYLGNEIFYNFNADRLYKHRVCAGLLVPLHEKIRLELFYYWDIEEQTESWHDTNILGSYVRFKF